VDAYIRGIRRVSQFCGIVAAALIALSVLVVCEMVFVRYVLNHNTIWQTDFVTWSLVAATFIGSPYLLLSRGHVNVDVLPQYLGPQKRWWLALASISMSLAFCAVMTILAAHFWFQSWENRWVSESMWRARLWIPYSAMPVGFCILSLQYVADLYCLLAGREPPFGIKPRVSA
jgi:TRAP-type C4-dicarboxylate transport system permease small subunit